MQTPASQVPSAKKSDKIPSCKKTRLMESQVQVIKEIGMNITRTSPAEWNEFMTVALGIPEEEPLPFLQTSTEDEDESSNQTQT